MDLKFKDLTVIYEKIFNGFENALPNADKLVYEKILQTVADIVEKNEESIKLEDKIVLSIGIRLLAEKYMIDSINDSVFLNSITKNQTRELYDKFVELLPNEYESKNILERVNLMTPEGIHLNSFMYEPILDMSPHHLYKLYNDVKGLS